MCTRPSFLQRGVSLVELIMFIVITSVALTGILLVMNVVTKSSADPMLHKQALAIAESLLEEVELMPFTYCDPDDANAGAAASAGACAATPEALGPETIGTVTEDRYGTSAPAVNASFDNVNDYHGFTMNSGNGGIKDIYGTAIPALSGYSATVAVTDQGAAFVGTAGDALQITVSVTAPDGAAVTLDGYRTRFAPNSLP